MPNRLTRPNGSYTDYAYDSLFRLNSIANRMSNTTTVCSNAYTYNKAHMRIGETVFAGIYANAPRVFHSYSSNNVNQLHDSTNPSTTYTYTGGNMTHWVTKEGNAVTATYDAEDRLILATYTDSNSVAHSVSFTYGADDLMYKQVIDGVETRFVRDGYQIVQERDSSNAVTRSYVWDPTAPGGIGGLLEMKQNNSIYNYFFDGKGNVAAVIDNSQAVVASYRHDAFGVLLSQSGTLDQPYRFSTERYLSELELYVYPYRGYLPAVAKWLTADPIGESGGLNLYGFVLSSPINYVDLFGLEQHKYEGHVFGSDNLGVGNFKAETTSDLGGNSAYSGVEVSVTQASGTFKHGIFEVGASMNKGVACAKGGLKNDSFHSALFVAGIEGEINVKIKLGDLIYIKGTFGGSAVSEGFKLKLGLNGFKLSLAEFVGGTLGFEFGYLDKK